MRIEGARVLVTGATGGLGQAIVRAAAARGAKLFLTGRQTDVLKVLASEVEGSFFPADLADTDAPDAIISEAGTVDIMVANAGLPGSGVLTELTVPEINRALDVNLRAPIVMARKVAEAMAERNTGHLVFVSSLSGKIASSHGSIYSATKFGLRGFSLALRAELRQYGIGVSAVFPGFVRDAGLFADAKVKLPRYIGTSTSQDVARVVLRAIEHNVGEVDVAPLSVRLGVRLATLNPSFALSLQRALGGERIAASIAAGQVTKR
jgi:short-subunit dehydrogenase